MTHTTSLVTRRPHPWAATTSGLPCPFPDKHRHPFPIVRSEHAHLHPELHEEPVNSRVVQAVLEPIQKMESDALEGLGKVLPFPTPSEEQYDTADPMYPRINRNTFIVLAAATLGVAGFVFGGPQ
eukprot:gnl/Hemi2/15184_TR5121_c0_g9_i1.p1 gnl/Hemi2/15184_TR5121_c0_g9~~gnl/Hemi2/15184_TR5121_c0_g9_i1.p1  ORF type:complete len:125 (-),score=34.30 gnl/Hemi2/15184_TR5121_c0_g9_i1:118-492(-)